MEEIEVLRKQIDIIDQMIVKQFCERLIVCRKIGEVKKNNKITIEDLNREAAVLKRLADFCDDERSEFVGELYREIFRLCKKYQIESLK